MEPGRSGYVSLDEDEGSEASAWDTSLPPRLPSSEPGSRGSLDAPDFDSLSEMCSDSQSNNPSTPQNTTGHRTSLPRATPRAPMPRTVILAPAEDYDPIDWVDDAGDPPLDGMSISVAK